MAMFRKSSVLAKIFALRSMGILRTKMPFDLTVLKHFFKQHVPLFCTVNYRK